MDVDKRKNDLLEKVINKELTDMDLIGMVIELELKVEKLKDKVEFYWEQSMGEDL